MNELVIRVNVNRLTDMQSVDAGRLLNELREGYQALALKEREQVTAFIYELSREPVTCIGELLDGRHI